MNEFVWMCRRRGSCVVFVPCDVIKERLQVQRAPKDSLPTSGGPSSYRGSGDALRTIMRTEGLGGIYKVCSE